MVEISRRAALSQASPAADASADESHANGFFRPLLGPLNPSVDVGFPLAPCPEEVRVCGVDLVDDITRRLAGQAVEFRTHSPATGPKPLTRASTSGSLGQTFGTSGGPALFRSATQAPNPAASPDLNCEMDRLLRRLMVDVNLSAGPGTMSDRAIRMQGWYQQNKKIVQGMRRDAFGKDKPLLGPKFIPNPRFDPGDGVQPGSLRDPSGADKLSTMAMKLKDSMNSASSPALVAAGGHLARHGSGALESPMHAFPRMQRSLSVSRLPR